jgi:hypothetical protein
MEVVSDRKSNYIAENQTHRAATKQQAAQAPELKGS